LAGIFLDTGAWIGLTDPTDRRSEVARDYFRRIGRHMQLVTSNYVLQEAVTWLVYHNRRRSVPALRGMVRAAESTGWLGVIWVTPALDELAWHVFDQFDDQDFSFADCSSIAICRDEGIDRAFSFDRHFTIAGLATEPQI